MNPELDRYMSGCRSVERFCPLPVYYDLVYKIGMDWLQKKKGPKLIQAASQFMMPKALRA